MVFAALAAVFSIFAGSSPAQAGTLGCVNYSGATYLGSIVLDTSGFVIGCQQPTGANLDLIPLGSWDDWDTWFQSQYSAFITRLGFACDDCWMSASGRNGNVGIPIGFDVNRYGTTYDRVFVNSNGSLSFNHGSSSYDYPLNEILGEDPGICAYCLDLQNNTHLNQLTALATGWSLTGTTRHSDFVYR